MFHFRRIDSHPALREYIKGYWLMQKMPSDEESPLLLVPDGYPELMFQVEGRFEVKRGEEWEVVPSACLLGQISSTIQMRAEPGSCAFFVKMYPWVSYLFFDLAQKDFTDQNVDLELLSHSKSIRDLAARIRSTAQFSEAVQLLNDFLLYEINLVDKKHPLLRMTIQQILEHKGRLGIDDLRRKVQYSNRYLEQLFKKGLGLSPKRFSRIIRNKAITCKMASLPPENLSAFAQEMGYYDQAHFIKDFKSITQLTPSAFLTYMQDFPIREMEQYLDQYR